MCCCKYNSVWLLLVEELFYRSLIGEVELFVTAAYKVIISTCLQIIPNGRTHESVMSCHKYFTVFT